MSALDVPVVAFDFEAGERAIQANTRDGRHLRAVRSRNAILHACRACMLDGDFRPSIVTVSMVAGVSKRSVFQHFTTLDELYRQALDQPTRDRIRDLVLRDCLPVSQADADRLVLAAVYGRG